MGCCIVKSMKGLMANRVNKTAVQDRNQTKVLGKRPSACNQGAPPYALVRQFLCSEVGYSVAFHAVPNHLLGWNMYKWSSIIKRHTGKFTTDESRAPNRGLTH